MTDTPAATEPTTPALAEHTPSTLRIEAFSDAVIAIVMTLLVLEIHVPELPHGAGVAETLSAVIHLWPKLAGFALSFVILCIFWVNHHQFFHMIDHADRKVLWLNANLLLWLCLIPFVTALLGEDPSNAVSAALFGFVLFMAALSFSLMGHYVLIRSHLVHGMTDEQRRAEWKRTWFGVIAYGLSVPLAFASVLFAHAIFILVPAFYFVPSRIFKQVMG